MITYLKKVSIYITLLLSIVATSTVYAASIPTPGYQSPVSSPAAPVQSPSALPGFFAPNNAAYVYVKGGEIYADFAGIPDFVHYARLPGNDVVSYPTSEHKFYYLGHSDVEYSYRTKIIDYINPDPDSVVRYKETIRDIGFKSLTTLESDGFWEYTDLIDRELLYDPDFILDSDGIFMAEGIDTFRLLLIGTSVTSDIYGNVVECVELRFYSLSKSTGDMLDLISVVGTLDFSAFNTMTPATQYFYYTPDALGDVREISARNVNYLFTPNAFEDISN